MVAHSIPTYIYLYIYIYTIHIPAFLWQTFHQKYLVLFLPSTCISKRSHTSTVCFVLPSYLYCCNNIWIVPLIRNLIWTGELCDEVSCNFFLLNSHPQNKQLAQSVPKITSPMPQSSKNWFELVKNCKNSIHQIGKFSWNAFRASLSKSFRHKNWFIKYIKVFASWLDKILTNIKDEFCTYIFNLTMHYSQM